MKEQLREWLRQGNIPPAAWNILLLAIAVLAGLLIRFLLGLAVRRNAGTNYSFVHSLTANLARPLSLFLPLFMLDVLLPLFDVPALVIRRADKVLEISLIISFSWLLVRSMTVAQDYVIHRYDYSKTNNLRERKIRTQLLYLRQVLTGFIILLTIAAILLSFDTMRKLGTGLLTGVGIGGIVVGFAAQRSLANLLAGFQIAFTQPIRIDDVVVIEGEWGRVEEITLTYVVLQLWDERRLVLPITYIIEKPFQNWTRNSSQLIGSVFIYADYNLPVEALRSELERLLHGHPLWDGRVKNLAVTNTTENTIEIRALVSAANSGNAFDLRCFVREKLVAFINEQYPQCLPRARAELDPITLKTAEQANPPQKTSSEA